MDAPEDALVEIELEPPDAEGPPAPSRVEIALEQVRPTIAGLAVLTLLTGVLYPLALAVPAWLFFRSNARGSLIARDGVVVGSDRVGQAFSDPGYFHGRPSSAGAGAGYDASSSGGTNLGPNNPKLVAGDESFAGVWRLAAEYRRENGLADETVVPIDAVTRSGSGLDPQISPENARLQFGRVARARGMDPEVVGRLVDEETRGRQLGFLGDPRVDVLRLNLALDRIVPRPGASP
jgi:K+-transporting ATPase ATPase C chain